jgi:hypothetical protein
MLAFYAGSNLNLFADVTQAKRFARAMKASLIFSSTSHSINVQKVCQKFAD